MVSFPVVCHVISILLSVITLIVGIYVGIKRIHTVRILPKALRFYMLACCYPYFFSTTFCAVYITTFYLLYDSTIHYTIEIARIIVSFSSQQIRNSLTLIVFERIIATIKLEKYTMAGKNKLLWRLLFISYSTSAIYVGYTIYAKSFPDIPLLYNVTNYYVYCTHIFMLGVCAVLYLLNRRMYKLSAYRISLKKRYSIAQNIKSLTYLFPPILIYSILAQFGSMITIIFQALNLPTAPVSVFHIFFNLSFLLIYFWHYFFYHNKTTENTRSKEVKTVTNPLGKNIPVNVTTDQYFRNLQHQWI